MGGWWTHPYWSPAAAVCRDAASSRCGEGYMAIVLSSYGALHTVVLWGDMTCTYHAIDHSMTCDGGMPCMVMLWGRPLGSSRTVQLFGRSALSTRRFCAAPPTRCALHPPHLLSFPPVSQVLNPGVDKHIYQDVSVSLYSTGQVFMFSTYIASLNQQPDKGSILLQWMAANGTVMQNISSNVWPVEMWQADAERWYSYQRRLMKPFGAAQIRVNLMAKAEAGPVQVCVADKWQEGHRM